MEDSPKKKMGFATFKPGKHKKVSSKGGKAKVPKGFALRDPASRSENASKAAQIRWARVKAERLEQE